MRRSWLVWSDADGAATRSLRHAVTRGTGVLFLLLSAVCLYGAWPQHGTTARILSAVAFVLLATMGSRCLQGEVAVADFVPSFAAAVLVNLVPDATGSADGFVGTMAVTVWLIAVLTNLAPKVAASALAVATVAYFLVTWVGGLRSMGDAFDATVLNVGTCLAAAAFLQALVTRARLEDRLADERTALDTAAELHALEELSAERARRVLHDEVLSALRAVVDLPPERQDHVRRSARDAVTAVRRHLSER